MCTACVQPLFGNNLLLARCRLASGLGGRGGALAEGCRLRGFRPSRGNPRDARSLKRGELSWLEHPRRAGRRRLPRRGRTDGQRMSFEYLLRLRNPQDATPRRSDTGGTRARAIDTAPVTLRIEERCSCSRCGARETRSSTATGCGSRTCQRRGRCSRSPARNSLLSSWLPGAEVPHGIVSKRTRSP